MPHIVKPPKRRKRNHDNCKCQKKQIKTQRRKGSDKKEKYL